MIREDFRDGIDALHRIRTYGCGEDAPIDHVQPFGSSNMEILPYDAFP